MPAHLRHNFVVLAAEHALFLVGLSFASQSTVLPAFAVSLGAPNVVIGAIPALMTLGWFLPSLFFASHTERLPAKLPFILRYTAGERLPFLVLALAAFWLADALPRLTLATLLLMLAVITATGGVLVPAWMDIVGRAIPTELRGRFFALSTILGSLGGLLGGIATIWIFAAIAPPASYGVCFLIAGLFMALSWIVLALTREPPSTATPAGAPRARVFGQALALLRRDRNLSWFLAARGTAAFGSMATGFYTVYALDVLKAPERQIGVFTTAFLAGQLMSTGLLGWLADRGGHRLVIIAGALALAGANTVAVAAPSLAAFTAVYVLVGVNQAAFNVSGFAVMLEFAPAVGEQPTYVGLGSTTLAPVLFAAPLIGGLMADAVGFRAVFAIAAAFTVLGSLALTLCVRDPRHLWAATRRS
jgi:MFS family permease